MAVKFQARSTVTFLGYGGEKNLQERKKDALFFDFSPVVWWSNSFSATDKDPKAPLGSFSTLHQSRMHLPSAQHPSFRPNELCSPSFALILSNILIPPLSSHSRFFLPLS